MYNKPKRAKYGIPPRWLNCPRIGKVVNDIFIPFKVPLDESYDVPAGNSFTLEDFLSSEPIKNVGLVIDLTRTTRYYKSKRLEGVKSYYKLPCEGHDGPPTAEQIEEFNTCVERFLDKNPESHIAVHCTHGFNRTGFLIVCYLCDNCAIELETAVMFFKQARSPGIYKQDYLDVLKNRYGNGDEELFVSERPNWCEESDDDDNDEDESRLPEPADNLPDSDVSSDEAENNDSAKTGDATNIFAKSSRDQPKRKQSRNNKNPAFLKKTEFMPGIKGVSPVTDCTVIEEVQSQVRELMNNSLKFGFIGSQPVSMTRSNINMLWENRYMVSWKADGVRAIMLIADRDLVYLLDRDNCVYKVDSISFPTTQFDHMTRTLVDGEMVKDVVKGRKGDESFIYRFLIYDVMNVSGEYVGDLEFKKRFNVIQDYIIEPRSQFVIADQKKRESFSVRRKDFWPIKQTAKLLGKKFTQMLSHKMDGLIFQPAGQTDTYLIGRCDNLLKWKPPDENSIDFLLKVVYDKSTDSIPMYIGYLYVSGEREYFGAINNIRLEDRTKYDGKIVECSFDCRKQTWKIMRQRTDKSIPNHISTAKSVFDSMIHPVSMEDLLQAVNKNIV